MKTREYKLKMTDSCQIQVYEWLPEEAVEIKGIVQIAHGMAEHAMRYADFAKFLTDNEYAVYALDHRGHGKTAGKLDNVGFLAEKEGWAKLVSDFKELSFHLKNTHPEKPLYVMGHSMGSFVVRNMIISPGVKLEGAILSGTGGNPGLLGHSGVLLTKFLRLFFPAKSPSPFMDKLSFGAFNKAFKPNRTKFDWLSRDNEKVDQYIDDPFCGNVFSLGFFTDMLRGLLYISKQSTFNLVVEDLSILLFSGEKDPVGNNGKGVVEVYNKFKKAGVKNVTMKLFTNGRHEMLNETNRHEVYQYILEWIRKN